MGVLTIKKLSFPILERFYLSRKKSVPEIANLLNCSEHKVNYWLRKYAIPKRSISEAIYIKNHPHGDPFKVKEPLTNEEFRLYGLGVGLYWGEGHRKSKTSIRLGNTDPKLIRKFMDFLVRICGVKRRDIAFSLLIFSDIEPTLAKNFWIKALRIKPAQIRGKITVIKSGSIGNYRQKSKYGVLILQYHNRKLRDIVMNMIERCAIRELPM